MRRGDLAVGAGTVAMAVAIGLATLTPVSPGGPPGSDKLFHLAGFAALVGPVAMVRPGWLWLVLPLALAWGGLIELVQPMVGRSREMADWLADAAGAGLGAVAGRMLARLFR